MLSYRLRLFWSMLQNVKLKFQEKAVQIYYRLCHTPKTYIKGQVGRRGVSFMVLNVSKTLNKLTNNLVLENNRSFTFTPYQR